MYKSKGENHPRVFLVGADIFVEYAASYEEVFSEDEPCYDNDKNGGSEN